MKQKILVFALIVVVMCMCMLPSVPKTADVSTINAEAVTVEVEKAPEVVPQYNPLDALKARFENMLNRNFSYNEDIADIDILVNNAVLALLDKRDANDDSFIAETFVAQYIYDMYGIEIVDFSELNADMPHKDGFIYIIPRGYSIYNHTVTDVYENEDGSFTVTSAVSIDGHENTESEVIATTLFVKNENSCFGYNIIYSNIIENAVAL